MAASRLWLQGSCHTQATAGRVAGMEQQGAFLRNDDAGKAQRQSLTGAQPGLAVALGQRRLGQAAPIGGQIRGVGLLDAISGHLHFEQPPLQLQAFPRGVDHDFQRGKRPGFRQIDGGPAPRIPASPGKAGPIAGHGAGGPAGLDETEEGGHDSTENTVFQAQQQGFHLPCADLRIRVIQRGFPAKGQRRSGPP